MKDVVKVLPDKDGKYFVKLYGITFELVPVEKAEPKKPTKKEE